VSLVPRLFISYISDGDHLIAVEYGRVEEGVVA
jgi:hypothetical protein